MGFIMKTGQYSRVEPQDDRTIYEQFLKYITESGNGSSLNNTNSFAITDISYVSNGLDFTIQPCKLFVKGGYIIIDSDTTITLPPSSTNKVICRIDTSKQNIPAVETRTDSNSDTFTVITGTQIENQVSFTSTTLNLVTEEINDIQGIYEVLLYTVVTGTSGISSVTRVIKNFTSEILSDKVTTKKLQDGNLIVKEASNSAKLGNVLPSGYVQTTGDQSITGAKTFNTIPRVLSTSVVPTADTHLATKKYVDDKTASIDTSVFVKTTGAQNIGGVKTFTTLPETQSTPTNGVQFVNKSYVDAQIAALSLSAVRSIQRGRALYMYSNGYTDITISSVIVEKSFVLIDGSLANYYGHEFINNTTVRLYGTQGSSLAWQVVELIGNCET